MICQFLYPPLGFSLGSVALVSAGAIPSYLGYAGGPAIPGLTALETIQTT